MEENKKKHSHAGHRDRVRNRFEEKGITAFEDHEALEMLLFYAIPQRDTNQLAHTLIEEFGSLSGVFEAPISALENVKGMGRNAAILIKLMPDIYTKYLASKAKVSSEALDSTEKVCAYYISKLAGYDHEVVLATSLDNRLRVKKTIVVAEGDANSAEIDIKKIMSCVFNTNGTTVIIAHNHPMGIALPSKEDVDTTRAISNMLHKIGLKFSDSVIVSGTEAFSMSAKEKYSHFFD